MLDLCELFMVFFQNVCLSVWSQASAVHDQSQVTVIGVHSGSQTGGSRLKVCALPSSFSVSTYHSPTVWQRFGRPARSPRSCGVRFTTRPSRGVTLDALLHTLPPQLLTKRRQKEISATLSWVSSSNALAFGTHADVLMHTQGAQAL